MLLLSKVYNVRAKKVRRIYVYINAKPEGKLICAFKNGTRNLANFHQSAQKSQNWDFDEIYSFKVENLKV